MSQLPKEEPKHIVKGRKIAETFKEDTVRVILIKELQAYIKRNSNLGDFLNDIKYMGGTFGEFYGMYDTGSASQDYVEVKLADSRIFKFKKKDIYTNQNIQGVLL